MAEATRLILASGSAARKSLLEAAGLAFEVIPAEIDEGAVRDAIIKSGTPLDAAEIAGVLAAAKARNISLIYPDALVVGADQVLALGDQIYSKAENLAAAREVLSGLRGRTHDLVSAVALARAGTVHWQTSAAAAMTMRDFSDEFLATYLERTGDRILHSVGCYEVEGPGVQLFERIEGDYFTILGIPLLPLLARLRKEEMVAA